MTLRKRITTLLLLIVMLITMGGALFSAFSIKTGAAEAMSYSNVLDDLKKDETFNSDDYPAKAEDYSLQVIQIAESIEGELFIYVYQPCAKRRLLKAISINISKERKGKDFYNYTLTYLNSEGVLHKYKVNDFQVDLTSERYYEFSSIYRLPIDEKETTENNGNLVDEVSFPVGKSFKITDNTDGSQNVYVEDIDVIRVVDKYVGFMRYPQSYVWNTKYADCHFIAFTTDKKIENLLEADVYYVTQLFKKEGVGGVKTYGGKLPQYAYFKFDKMLQFESDSWFSLDYEWKTIEKSSSFLINEEETKIYSEGIFDVSLGSEVGESAKKEIASKEWVIRYAVTPYSVTSSGAPTIPYDNIEQTIVGEVSLLRLAFETEGVYYNLGVVDNKQTGKTTPDNETTVKTELSDTVMLMLGIIVVAVLIMALWNPIKDICKIVWNGLIFLFSIIWSVLTLPFKIIVFIFKK